MQSVLMKQLLQNHLRIYIKWRLERYRFKYVFQGQAKASQLVQPTMNMATDFYEGRWKEGNTSEENANARWPKAFIKQTYGDTWNGQASTWWLRNASFLRLKSVELGYTLPKDLTAKVGIQKHEFMSTEQTYLRLTTIRLLIRKQV